MAPRAGSKVGRLKRRPQFLAVAGAKRKWATAGLILQARAHDDRQHPDPGQPAIRIGLTASKKVGGAVERNRARRRLRAALAEVLAPHASAGHDYVLVARGETVRRPYAALKADLAQALKRLKLWRDKAGDVPVAGRRAPNPAWQCPEQVDAAGADATAPGKDERK